MNLGDDVAMGLADLGVADVVVGGAAVVARGADDVADLRGDFAYPIGPERVAGHAVEAVPAGSADVTLVRRRICKTGTGTGGPHHPGYKHRAPGMLLLPRLALKIRRRDRCIHALAVVLLQDGDGGVVPLVDLPACRVPAPKFLFGDLRDR